MKFVSKYFRVIIQGLFFVYILGIGFRFYFYLESVSKGDYSVVKPYGVEGFLPISALLGLKQLFATGVFDKIHPAGLTIFIAAIVMSLLLKKSFCAYVCPVGFISEQVSKMGLKLRITKWVHYPLSSIKYLLLGFFVYVVFFNMSVQDVTNFINAPYNKISDAKMMAFFLSPSVITIAVVGVLVGLTLLFKNFWCRYLCPYGALLGVGSFLSPFKVKRSIKDCINCGRCAASCPMDIPVDKRVTVVSPECFGCMNCIKNRQNDKCLGNGAFSRRYVLYGAFAVGIFFIFFVAAYFGGYWQSSVSNEEYGRWLQMMEVIGH